MANTYLCSNGMRITQSTIDRNLSKAYRDKHEGQPRAMCEAYPGEVANDNDHTISQKRCKELGKTELIWNPNNFVSSSRKAHKEWENWKSGAWIDHNNAAERMAFMKKEDPEGYQKRMNYEY